MVYDPLITVYTLPACVQCNATKRKLDQLQAEGKLRLYTTVDLSDPTNAAVADRLRDRGVTAAPFVIVTQDSGSGPREVDAWPGYDPDKLAEWAR